MKRHSILTILALILFSFSLSAREVRISENLKVVKISEHTYLHTGGGNNGIICVNKEEAVIVSTSETDVETQNLIDWIESQKLKIVGYILDDGIPMQWVE